MALIRTKSSMADELEYRFGRCQYWLESLKAVPDNLMSIFHFHKRMWDDGIRHDIFGPCQSGFYRTYDISTMKADQVFLGGVDGLFTHPIPFWENKKGCSLDAPDYYLRVCSQYRDNLMSGIQSVMSNIYDMGLNRCILESLLKTYLRTRSELHGEPFSVSHIHVLNACIGGSRIIECNIHSGSSVMRSSLVGINGRYFVPFGFHKGTRLSKDDLSSLSFHDLRDYIISDGQVNGVRLMNSGSVRFDKNPEKLNRKDLKDNLRHIKSLEEGGMRLGIKR